MKTTFVIKGTNFKDLIKECKKENISLSNLQLLSTTELKLSCNFKHKPKVIAILNKKCYTILSENNSSLFKIKPIFNVSVIVGIIFGILLNFLATFFVWNIKICGDETIKKEIVETMCSLKIKKGTLKSSINLKKLKEDILTRTPEVSLLSLSLNGTTLFVNFTKRTMIEKSSNSGENIVAKSDGMISSILCLSGTPLVKNGDYVKKGQILILGEETQDNKTKKVTANGQVFAYVWKSATLKFPLEKYLWAQTGNTQTTTKVLFNESVLFEKNKEITFKNYETEEKISYLTTSCLPLKQITTTYFELEKVLVSQNFEENKEKVCSQAKLLCWEQIKGDEQILEEKTEINFMSNIYFVTHYIKIKEKISWNLN